MSKLVFIVSGLLLSSISFFGSTAQAAEPLCVGLPSSGLLSKNTIIQNGSSPYLGVWWGNWSPPFSSNKAPSFFIVRSVSGNQVDITNIPNGVVESGNEYWRLESDGHIGANFPASEASYIFNVNSSGNLLSGTLYTAGQPYASITMSKCIPGPA
jgi:hypothetical protein